MNNSCMERHNHVIIKNSFNKYYCHICGNQFVQAGTEVEETLLDIFNLIEDEKYPLGTVEGVIVYIREQLKKFK